VHFPVLQGGKRFEDPILNVRKVVEY